MQIPRNKFAFKFQGAL